ncbi:hypothetical protein [Spirosoma validum]|uniref:Uncharacterized protein n=1 Tax=Spirosoma validum TaxID=2771355 RepID=A0A927AZW9_9BACT|nr:hypothetical protein [Spirosoma validum]MBD2752961.1 hypothetical protein [Spirosoma validum]
MNMVDNANSLQRQLTRVHVLLDSPVFNRDSAEDGPWKETFIELITLVHAILLQAQQADKRVEFLKDVGVNGKIQDITSLVEWMYNRLPGLTADNIGQQTDNRLNRYFDQGTGYFANGSFFTGDFDNELAFFIDDQRVYLNRHLRRAIDEVEQSLNDVSRSTL